MNKKLGVVQLIKKSLKELQQIAWENPNEIVSKKQNSRLIFPKYCVGNDKHKNTKRISEQEAKLLFVRELEQQTDFYFSIETPTQKPYKDFSTKAPKVDEGGQSARIDVTLHDNKFCRKHLIEFKYGNKESCKKDFLKLLCDDDQCETNYYINILENSNIGTIPSLRKKYNESVDYIFQKYSEKIKSDLFIIVFVLGEKDGGNYYVYKISKSSESIEEVKLEEI